MSVEYTERILSLSTTQFTRKEALISCDWQRLITDIVFVVQLQTLQEISHRKILSIRELKSRTKCN